MLFFMVIHYTVSEEDLLLYQLYVLSTNETLRMQERKTRLLLGGAHVLIALAGLLIGGDVLLAAIFVVMGILWVLLYPLWVRWYSKKTLRRMVQQQLKEWVDAPYVLRLEEERVVSAMKEIEGTVPWKEFTCFAEFPTLFLLFVDSAQAVVLPKRVLEDEVAVRSMLQDKSSVYGILYKYEERFWYRPVVTKK